MRVTVVRDGNGAGGADGEIWVIPHRLNAKWIRLPADENLDEGQVITAGQVGDLDHYDGVWEFVPVAATATLVGLQAGGPADRATFRLQPGGRDLVDLTDHGVPADLRNRAAADLSFWRLDPPGEVIGHLDHPDVASWEKEQRRRIRERDDRKARASQRTNAQSLFVNPYTFVPFPAEQPAPRRSAPAGHHTLAPGEDGCPRYQARITARLVARSPMLVRNVGSTAPTVGGVTKAPRTVDGEFFLPGSSLHGALRALHETLTGSCLRVFDPDFVPVYRDVASGALRTDWQLGVVDEVDTNGRPTRMRRCTATRWVPLDVLAGAGTPVLSGSRFDLDASAFVDRHGRQVYRRDAPVNADPNGAWVVHVSDDAARNRKVEAHLCAVGLLPTGGDTVAPTDRAWADFRRAAEGTKQFQHPEPRPDLAEEQRRIKAGASLDAILGKSTGKIFPGMGRFLRPRPWLHPGQVVWLGPVSGREVTGVALAYLWRTAGSRSAGERIPPGFDGCDDPEELCASCRVFGSADTRLGADRRRAEQRSYRGHVRVLDAVRVAGDEPEEVTLPAMGAPRPGSGQFYLEEPQQTPGPNQQPRNRWGPLDGQVPRRLRGRKFYWHTDPEIDRRRQRGRAHHWTTGDPDRAELLPAGSAWDVTLVVDGLTESEIGGLVATLQPHRLFATRSDPLPYTTDDEPEYAIHIGGGKPFGYGSCTVTDLTVTLDDADSRYLGDARRETDPDELVAAFAADHADAMAGSWPLVAAALHTAHVDSRIVGYPPAVDWADDSGRPAGRKTYESFTWFSQTVGERMNNGPDKPFVALPDVGKVVQGLPIEVKEAGQ